MEVESLRPPKSDDPIPIDGMLAHCDEFTLINIFDSVGIALSYEEAYACLRDHARRSPSSQVSVRPRLLYIEYPIYTLYHPITHYR